MFPLLFFILCIIQEGKPECCSWWWKKTILIYTVSECVAYIAKFFRSKIANVFESAFEWSFSYGMLSPLPIDIVTVNILLNILDCIHSLALSRKCSHTKKNYIMVHNTGTSMKGSLIKKLNWERFFFIRRM